MTVCVTAEIEYGEDINVKEREIKELINQLWDSFVNGAINHLEIVLKQPTNVVL